MKEQGQWSSTFGFIMASAGAAVGLGNIWGFPYRLGQGGGMVFLALYLIFAALIGYPMLLGEFSLGRRERKEPVSAGKALGFPGMLSGAAGLLSCFIILAYYCFFGGMILNYLISYIVSGAPGAEYFASVSASVPLSVTGHLLFAAIILLVVHKGVQRGIERCSVIMMPLLLVMLTALCVFTLTLDGASAGLKFLLRPDFSKLNIRTVISALTQVTFSLSIGQGIMVVYGSYLGRGEDLEKSALSVAVFDTLVALLAAAVIMPAAFSLGITAESGPGLMFETLPLIFSKLPGGRAAGFVFFALLLFAAVTSAVSMLETLAYTLAQRRERLGKKRAAALISGAAALFGLPVCLGVGGLWKGARILGMDIFGLYEFISQAVLISVSLLAFCAGASKRINVLSDEIERGSPFRSRAFWRFSVRFASPLLIAAVLLLMLGII